MFVEYGPDSLEFQKFCKKLVNGSDENEAIKTTYKYINKNGRTAFLVPYTTEFISDLDEGFTGAKLFVVTLENLADDADVSYV